MGHTVHTVIIVTCFDEERLRGMQVACGMAGAIVTPPVLSGINGFWTFMVAPDGSKSGWEDDQKGDQQRESIKKLLRAERDEDGGNSYEWFECDYGMDDRRAAIIDSEWTEYGRTSAVPSKKEA